MCNHFPHPNLKFIVNRVLIQEVNSLCGQLSFTYSSNRSAMRPFSSILCTSLNGRTRKRLDYLGDASYLRWRGVRWWEDDFDKLWSGEAVSEVKFMGDDKADSDGDKVEKETDKAEKGSVVYLSADADDELEELTEGETYVIGGICDKNRYKVRIPLVCIFARLS